MRPKRVVLQNPIDAALSRPAGRRVVVVRARQPATNVSVIRQNSPRRLSRPYAPSIGGLPAASHAANSTRLRKPSLPNALPACFSTVLRVMNN